MGTNENFYGNSQILVSIQKSNDTITNIEIYKYMGEFFFGFLFQLFFLEPDYGSLITSIIISKEKKKKFRKNI